MGKELDYTYESLRESAISNKGYTPGKATWGAILFLRRGFHAWLQAVKATHKAPQKTYSVEATPVIELPQEAHVPVGRVISKMILDKLQEIGA